MTNPFEDDDGRYTVLTNVEGQHCLWPGSIEIPAGWRVVHGPTDRRDCLAFVTLSWPDLRPRSLVVEMDGHG